MRKNKSNTNETVGSVIEALETSVQKELKARQEKLMQSIAVGKKEHDDLGKANKTATEALKQENDKLTACKGQVTLEGKKIEKIKEDIVEQGKIRAEGKKELGVLDDKKAEIQIAINLLEQEHDDQRTGMQKTAKELASKVALGETALELALAKLKEVKENLQQYVENSVNV